MNVPFVDLHRIHAPLKKELEQVFANTLANSSFILGDDVPRFEQEFAIYSGARYGVGVANGTDGLFIALKSCGIGPGDEVITQAHTFIASALGITYAGATPVFADIDESYTLDPQSAERFITKKTKAILPVSLYGQPAHMKELQSLARHYKLKLIVDNAQAHGATYNKHPLGHYGDASSYSFYPAKNLGAFGDGGMILTNGASIEKHARLLRNIGRTGWYEHPVKGYNSRLDTLHAGILSIKLKHLDRWNAARRKAAAVYTTALQGLPLELPKEFPDRTHVYHLYVVRVKQREKFITYMLDHDIHVAIHYPKPVHKQKAYQELPKKKLPLSESVAHDVVSLPFFVGITEQEQEYVTDTIKAFFG